MWWKESRGSRAEVIAVGSASWSRVTECPEDEPQGALASQTLEGCQKSRPSPATRVSVARAPAAPPARPRRPYRTRRGFRPGPGAAHDTNYRQTCASRSGCAKETAGRSGSHVSLGCRVSEMSSASTLARVGSCGPSRPSNVILRERWSRDRPRSTKFERHGRLADSNVVAGLSCLWCKELKRRE